MKKNLKILTAVLGCALLLSACGNNSSNNGDNSGNQQGQGIKKSIFDVPVEDGVVPINQVKIQEKETVDVIEPKVCDEIYSGTCGGSLIDLMVGSYIEPLCTYDCSFVHTKTFSGEYTVRSDDRAIAQVSHEAGTGTFTVKGITTGDAIIQAVTEDNDIVLQFVVHVRKRLALEDIPAKLFATDVFYGMSGVYKLSFTEVDPIKGVLTGKDDFESTSLTFKLGEGVEERISNGTDFNTYKFKISADNENSVTSRNYTYLYVSTTGEKIYFYYSNGLVDIFTDYKLNLN